MDAETPPVPDNWVDRVPCLSRKTPWALPGPRYPLSVHFSSSGVHVAGTPTFTCRLFSPTAVSADELIIAPKGFRVAVLFSLLSLHVSGKQNEFELSFGDESVLGNYPNYLASFRQTIFA